MYLLAGSFIQWNLNLKTILMGAVMSIPPIIVNFFIWSYAKNHSDSIFYRFSSEVITPLCRSMNFSTICVVAIMSGVCEEFFFRGVLNSIFIEYCSLSISCLATSTLFALVHFIGNFKRYWTMLPLYFAMGCYLWIVHQANNSLGCVALTHGMYNFIVITITKYSGIPHRSKPLMSIYWQPSDMYEIRTPQHYPKSVL